MAINFRIGTIRKAVDLYSNPKKLPGMKRQTFGGEQKFWIFFFW